MKWLLIIPAIVLGGILALVILVMFLRVGVRMLYRDQTLQVWIKAGPVRIRVFPLEKKQTRKRRRPERKPTRKKSGVNPDGSMQKAAPSIAKTIQQAPPEQRIKEKNAPLPNQKKMDISLEVICAYTRFALESAGRLIRGLRVDKLWLKADIATDDAAKTALAYGRACAAVSNLLPMLDRTLNLRKRDFTINACFEKSKTEVEGEIMITAMIGRMALIGLCILIRFVKLKKAVSKNEQSQ